MKTHVFVVTLLGLLFSVVPNVEAVTYKYIDKAGMVCFADDLQAIPDQYRSQAVLIEGEIKEASFRSSVTATAAGQGAPTVASTIVSPLAEPVLTPGPPAKPVSMPISTRLLITIGVSIALIVLTGVLGRQRPFSEDRMANISLKTGASVFFLVYLVFAHGRDMVTIVRMAGRAVDTVQARSAEKGKRAAEGIKKLDALFQEMQAAEEDLQKAEEQAATEKNSH